MDIKLKSNKEIYKSKGIIAILVMIAIIVTSALGMCSSYKIIDKSAKSKKVNYFNEYGFANLIAESSYALYYDSMKENENQSASDFLLDIKKNITEEADEYSSYIQEALNNNIDQFNRETLGWNNDANLKYYYYNTINNKTNTTLNENVKFENNNIDLSEVNKDKYQFYAVVNFDNNGNVDVSEINGGDKEVLKSNIECSLIDIRNEYDISNSDYEEGYYNIDIKPIKNMTFVYAVPKTITSYDNIRWGIENADISIYESMGAGGAFIIAGIVALIALIFPIKKAKSTILFRKISKIPFEVWIIIIGLAIAALGPLAGQLIKATLNGDLQVIFVEIIPSLIIPERIIWIFNFIIWLLSYSAVFFFVLVIKYVFNVGVIDYIKERTIFGMVIMLCVRIIKRTLDEITKVDLREKNNKLIIKLEETYLKIKIG